MEPTGSPLFFGPVRLLGTRRYACEHAGLQGNGFPEGQAGVTTHVWTDGACSGNPGPGGWVFVVKAGDKIIAAIGGHSPDSTNNRMEFRAAERALYYCAGLGAKRLVVHTDSLLLVNVIRKDLHTRWKCKNKELLEICQSINALGAWYSSVEWVWVKAHSSCKMNKLADQLARFMVKTDKGRDVDFLKETMLVPLNRDYGWDTMKGKHAFDY